MKVQKENAETSAGAHAPKDAASRTEHRRQGHSHEGGHDHHVKHTPEEWAERLDNPERDGWQKPAALIGMMEITPGQTVAEIGAGTGYFLKYLSEAVGKTGKVLARDVEDDLVAYIEDRVDNEGLTNVAADKCAFDDPGLPEGGMDRVLIVNTWHHITDRVQYGKTVHESLSENGALFVVDFTKESTVGPPPESKLHDTQVIDELEKAGFKTELLSETLPQQYVIKASRP